MITSLNDGVGALKGVGSVRTAQLEKAGIFTVRDLLFYFPRDYADRSVISRINELEENRLYTVRAKIVKTEALVRNEKTIVKAAITDGTGFAECVWFNQPYLKNRLIKGDTYHFSGMVKRGDVYKFCFESPDTEKDASEMLKSGRIVPMYPLRDKLPFLRKLIKAALEEIADKNFIEEVFSDEFLTKYNLCGRRYAIFNVHFPTTDEAFILSRRRLAFEELTVMQIALLNLKGRVTKNKGEVFAHTNFEELKNILPFALTNAQCKVLQQLQKDFVSGFAMNRLVQGDVGSGKTVVALAGCYIAAKNGFQSAVMAPTEVLARQHLASFTNLLSKVNLKVEGLFGSLTAREKKSVKKRLLDGEIDVLVGTHALIQENVEFARLGFAVTDEQHRFGVRQRVTLSEKGSFPHTLVMTATPIPRTLALVLYGDLDVSVIDELPPGRQVIKTNAVNSSYHERIYAFIKKHVNLGRQAYIVCPLVELSDVLEAKAVTEYAKELQNNGLRGLTVECLHGRMKPDEKTRIMNDFASGNIDVLVSTTVIEVGINVPNAVIMMIENCERFGLSQLHQLRGRVGRGEHQSFCILVSDAKNAVAKGRMKAMTETNDGFLLSEKDLELRGPGEFFGTRQHGLPDLTIANVYKDAPLLKVTREAALELFENDKFRQNKALTDEIMKMMGKTETIYL